jgi:hypothetical protein
MMDAQRREQKEVPVKTRVGIGGEIQCFVLQPGLMTFETVHRFADYEADYAQMDEGSRPGYIAGSAG